MTQFHITNWTPDGVCANLATITEVIEELDKVQRRTGNHPIVVHCRYCQQIQNLIPSVMIPIPPIPVTLWDGQVCSVPSPW